MAVLAACAVQHMHVMNAEGPDKPAPRICHFPPPTDARRQHLDMLRTRLGV